MEQSTQRGIGILLIIVIVAAVGLAGAGTYVAVKSKTSVEAPEAADTGTASTSAALSGSASIKSILALGENLRCTFSTVHATGKTEGVVYVADRGTRTRGDFTTETTSSGRVESHFLRQGNAGYMWTGSMKQGIKMEIPEGQALPSSPESSENQSVDFDANVTYDCEKWSVDGSRFELPVGIEFMTIGNITGGAGGGGAGVEAGAGANASVKASQCSACDFAPSAAAKAECKVALGC